MHLKQPPLPFESLTVPRHLPLELLDLGVELLDLPQASTKHEQVGGGKIIATHQPGAAQSRSEGRARQRHPVSGEHGACRVLEFRPH